MKNIRSIITLILCLVILSVTLVCVPASAEENGIVYSMFHFQLRRNTALAKYGVTVYLEDIEVGHLNQGEQIPFGAYMLDGTTHVLRLKADKEGVPDYEWTLVSLQNGMTVTCTLQAHGHYIAIPQTEMIVDGVSVVRVAPDIEKQVRVAGTVVTLGAGLLMGGE